jgi:SAM-dependent methyltransferase
MVSRIKALLPPAVEPLLIRTWYAFRPIVRMAFFGRARYCPVCRSHCRRFLAHGPSSRRVQDVVCPVCLSHPRLRLAWLFLSTRTDLLDGRPKQMLHIAPEPALTDVLRTARGIETVSADLASPHAMIRLDITSIDRESASFHVILCSHVLEHVEDDRRAMRELFRVLRPGGWAVIQVPISSKPTFEDPSITDPAERERLFWQVDHVRLYGLDISDRLTEAGFQVETIFGDQLVASDQLVRTGIYARDLVFLCRKRSR